MINLNRAESGLVLNSDMAVDSTNCSSHASAVTEDEMYGLTLLSNTAVKIQNELNERFISPISAQPVLSESQRVTAINDQANRHDMATTSTNFMSFLCKFCGELFKLKNNLNQHIFNKHYHNKPYRRTAVHASCTTLVEALLGGKPHQTLKGGSKVRELEKDSVATSLIDQEVKKRAGISDIDSSRGDGSIGRSDLEKHLSPQKMGKNFYCDICKITFTTKGSATRHIKTTHNHHKYHKCSECNYECVNKNRLTQHMEEHVMANEFLCDLCGSTFTQKGSLNRHMKILHSNYKSHVCNVCNVEFINKYMLTQHMEEHVIDHEFLCNVCGNTFTQKGSLNRHMKSVHGNDKSYACNVCNDEFINKYMLTQHMEEHIIDDKFLCNLCGNTFTQKVSLIRHVNQYHNETKRF